MKLDIFEAAKIIDVSVSYARRLAALGTIKSEKIGRDYFFKKSDLKGFKRQRKKKVSVKKGKGTNGTTTRDKKLTTRNR